MYKTAEQIADEVLEKVAQSRWKREGVRSLPTQDNDPLPHNRELIREVNRASKLRERVERLSLSDKAKSLTRRRASNAHIDAIFHHGRLRDLASKKGILHKLLRKVR